MIDQHYTPSWLAEAMAARLPSSTRSVADFCAGEGALLDAAQRWLPEAALYGTDLDPKNVQSLKQKYGVQAAGRMDLLSVASRRSSRIFRDSTFDGVLLNPPFSYRGGAGVLVLDRTGAARRVSPSLAFVGAAISAIKPGGSLVALLPANALESQRDGWWREEPGAPELRVVEVIEPRKFPGVVARMVLVVARRSGPPERSTIVSTPDVAPVSASEVGVVDLVRGRVPVHVAKTWTSGFAPFIHTRELQEGALSEPRWYGPSALASKGPFVLLPRVGRFTPGKIVRANCDSAILSDCVYALRVDGVAAAESLAGALEQNHQILAAAYQGSCAPYLTISRLKEALGRIGYYGVHVPA